MFGVYNTNAMMARPKSGRLDRLTMLIVGTLPPSAANTISDHIFAFPRFSRHHVVFRQNTRAVFGDMGGLTPTFPKSINLATFDVLILHYSCYLPGDSHFDAQARQTIRDYRGLKILLIQDEYRQVNVIHDRIRELGIDVLFTCVPTGEIEKVYPSDSLPGLTKVNTLTGFVPEALLKHKVSPIARRPIHVGYRARRLPFWLGELAVEKWRIVPQFQNAVAGSGLRLDVSYQEADRIYGGAWLKFIKSCKCTLGVESGASVFDFTGEIQRSVEEYVARHPDAKFEEVQQAILAPHEGRIVLNQISPRCFEAAALRTAMVLFEGHYSHVLEPWRHYIPLKKDFSNISEVTAAIRDDALLQALVDRTYREIALNPEYSYAAFVSRFDDVVEAQILTRHGSRLDTGYRVCGDRLQLGPGWPLPIVERLRIQEYWISTRALLLRARFRIIHTALGLTYKIYVTMFSAVFRDRLRPFVRRVILKKVD